MSTGVRAGQTAGVYFVGNDEWRVGLCMHVHAPMHACINACIKASC